MAATNNPVQQQFPIDSYSQFVHNSFQTPSLRPPEPPPRIPKSASLNNVPVTLPHNPSPATLYEYDFQTPTATTSSSASTALTTSELAPITTQSPKPEKRP